MGIDLVSKTPTQTAKKRRRAEETDEEREQRLNPDATLATPDRSTASLMDALNGDETASTRSMSSMELYNLNRRQRRAEETPEQREQRLARERERDAARKAEHNESRRKRQAEESPDAKAQRLKKRREKSLAKAGVVQPEGDIALQRREEHARRVEECEPATREFHRRFTNNPFGCVCSVYERLWHKEKLTPVLKNSPLYKHYDVKIVTIKFNKMIDDIVDNEFAECDNVGVCDPVTEALARTLDQHTMVYAEDFTLTIAPGEGKKPLSIL
ncbi:uncharacterized protein [Dermacentor andersoni]|uniref:uncharacterized protein n=1 Tax=Dermacentor andersoni TaxID=34620 RepID=UPI003B3A9D9D